MSTRKQLQNKYRAATAKPRAAPRKASARIAREVVQHMKKNPQLSQPQFKVAGAVNSTDIDDARQCELEYLAAKADPFSAKRNPCSLGYKNMPSIVCKKQLRFVFYAGPEEKGGLAFIALNTYLAGGEDINAIAYTDSAYDANMTWDLNNLAGVTTAPLTGGFFTRSDLSVGEDNPGFVSSRVVVAQIRFKPAGAAVATQGLSLGRQISAGGEALTPTQIYATAVPVSDGLKDISKPIYNVTNDGEWTAVTWTPITVPEGDLIPHQYFTGTTNVKTQGANLLIGISGAQFKYPFIGEAVVITEYISLGKGLSMVRPSHQNQTVASFIDTIFTATPTFHGVPIQPLLEGCYKLAQYWGVPIESVKKKVASALGMGGDNDSFRLMFNWETANGGSSASSNSRQILANPGKKSAILVPPATTDKPINNIDSKQPPVFTPLPEKSGGTPWNWKTPVRESTVSYEDAKTIVSGWPAYKISGNKLLKDGRPVGTITGIPKDELRK